MNYRFIAKYYDKIYHWKDYKTESEKIHSLIKKYKKSEGDQMLDVACGTGNHIKFLKKYYEVTGIDLNRDMLKIARKNYPGNKFILGDMRTFRLEKKFDVIVCLFSSIAYMTSQAQLRKAVKTFSVHLKPGGVVIIEGFISPEDYKPDLIHTNLLDEPDQKVFRMTKTSRRRNVMTMDFHVLAADKSGINYVREKHSAAMYEDKVFIDIMKKENLETVCLKNGLMKDRSLFIGTKKD